MKNPYVPNRRVDIAIISKDASAEIFHSIDRMGIKPIPTVEAPNLHKSVANHPDMVLALLPDGSVVAAPSVWDYYSTELQKHGIRVIKGRTALQRDYPDDVPYNIVLLNDTLVHRLDVTDGAILEFADRFDMKKLNIRQGYSKCSLVIVNEKSGITSDEGIFRTLSGQGFDILLIRPGHIRLPGMDYGFIGGATGLISKHEMVVAGSLNLHPDGVRIEEFLADRGVSLVNLSEEPAMDIGTIIGLSAVNG
jgi:hypothetical protein